MATARKTSRPMKQQNARPIARKMRKKKLPKTRLTIPGGLWNFNLASFTDHRYKEKSYSEEAKNRFDDKRLPFSGTGVIPDRSCPCALTQISSEATGCRAATVDARKASILRIRANSSRNIRSA